MISSSSLIRVKIWLLVLLVSCAAPQRRPDRPLAESVHALLSDIKIAEPGRPYPRYRRGDWMGRWDDADGDCQNTRMEVLLRDAIQSSLDRSGCKVIAGRWDDPYTGEVYSRPSDIDIDHMVPLHEAHRSGGYRWTRARKKEYANYLGNAYHLLAVQDAANQKKSDKSPERWMPANKAYHCVYMKHWSRIKKDWDLTMTRAEFNCVNAKLKECDSPGTTTNADIVCNNRRSP